MKLHRLLALALIVITACGNDTDAGAPRATERLVVQVEAIRHAATAGDRTSFAATTAGMRAELAALRADGQITGEKAASIEQQLAIVEAEFARTVPTNVPSTTLARPTTTTTTTTAAPDDEDEDQPRGKRKKDEDD